VRTWHWPASLPPRRGEGYVDGDDTWVGGLHCHQEGFHQDTGKNLQHMARGEVALASPLGVSWHYQGGHRTGASRCPRQLIMRPKLGRVCVAAERPINICRTRWAWFFQRPVEFRISDRIWRLCFKWRKLQKKTTTFGVRILKNHHFSDSLQKTTSHTLIGADSTDCRH
jgi:hypothetical protein